MREKTEPTHKTTLLLDLDETTFIALTEEEYKVHGSSYESIKKYKGIHPSHTLSAGIVNSGIYFFVLNPELLKTMIETVYTQGDDIAIFTTGLWLPPVLQIVSQLCGLNNKVALQFHQSLFLNPQNDGEKLGYTSEATRTLPKAYRLHGLFRSMDVLRSRYFILLDNDNNHINSCDSLPYIQGVRATSDTDDKSFYETVPKEMALAHSDDRGLSPSSPAYYFTSEILKALLQLEVSSLNQRLN